MFIFSQDEILKKNSDVNMAFMLDATSSMELNLEAVEKNIEEVVLKVKDTFFDIKVRVARCVSSLSRLQRGSNAL